MPDRIDGMDIIPMEEYFSRDGKDEEKKPTSLPDPPAFPFDALPEALANLARDGAAAISCPADYLGCAVLGIAAGAIGSSRVARIKSSWVEPSVLYIGLVGPSGDGKTPATKEASLPVVRKQDRLFSLFKKELKDYEQAMREHKVEESTARKEERAASPPPEKPFLESVFVADTTYEALVEALYRNPRGLVRLEDELAGMCASFDQYKGGKGRERSLWLSIWSAQPVKVDRKTGDGSVYVPNPCVSLVGNIQPRLLPQMLPLEEDYEGFAARILFTYPNPVPMRWTDDEISLEVRSKYAALITGLYGLEHGIDTETLDEDKAVPLEVPFTREARTRFAQYINTTAEEASAPGFDDRLAYAWSKLRGYCARVALVLAMCRVVKDEAEERIELSDVENAISIIDYFKRMARRVYASMYGQRPIDQLASDVVGLLKTLPDNYWYGRPEAGFTMIREASDHSPATASELCRKLESISNTHPVLRFEHGHERNKEKKRYWLLELVDGGGDGSGGGPGGPPGGGATEKSSKNGVRGVRGVRRSETLSKNEINEGNGEVIQFPTSSESTESLTEYGSEQADNNEAEEKYELIETPEDLTKTVSNIKAAEGPIGFDVETYPQDETARALDPRRGEVGVISLAVGDLVYVVDTKKLEPEPIRKALEDALSGRELVAHNASFDLGFLKTAFGYTHCGRVYDTQVLSGMLFYAKGPRTTKAGWKGFTSKDKESGYTISLAKLVEDHLGRTLDKETRDSDWGGDLTPEMVGYAAQDAAVLPALKDKMVSELESLGMGAVVDLEARFTPAMAYATSNGFAFDVDGWREHAAQAAHALEKAKAECDRLAPDPPEGVEWAWNASNHRKVGLALELLGADVKKNPDTGNYLTGEAALKAISGPLGGRLLNISDERSIRTEADLPEGVEYIGREIGDSDTGEIRFHESIWHNQFKEGRDGTREEVIAKFRNYVRTSDEPRAQEMRRRLPEIAGKTLACWCFPEGCHGEVLLELANQGASTAAPSRARALVEAILEYRRHEKYVTTWGDSWFKEPWLNKKGKVHAKSPDHLIVHEGRVYTRFNQLVATGRGSSREPNMQNLPPELRGYFIAPPGRKLLIADYSQIEYATAAYLAGDEALLAPLREGRDFHRITAEMIGIERHRAKMVNFGILYGMSPKGLAKRLDIDRATAERYIETIFDRTPGLAAWYRDTCRRARRGDGEATTPLGRRRLLDMNLYDGRWVANRSQALNHPIQGACADGYKMAGALIWENAEDFAGNPLIVNMIHDEYVLEVDAEDAEADARILEKLMIQGMKEAVGEGLPVRVDVEIADTWSDKN